MISPQIAVRDINPSHWARLLDLFIPPPGGDPSPAVGAGPLAALVRATEPSPASSSAISAHMPAILLHRGGQLLRIARLGGGTWPVAEFAAPVNQHTLRRWRKQRHLPFAVAVDVKVLPRLLANLQAAVRYPEGFMDQQCALVDVLRQELGAGVLVDPPLMDQTARADPALFQRVFDALLPDGRSAVFYLIDNDSIYTSVIVSKQQGCISLLTTHDAIADAVLFRSIRTSARAVVRCVAARIAPPQLAVFIPMPVWYEWVAGDRSAIARALAARKAVLDPCPPWLLTWVGAGALVEAVSRTGRWADHLLSGRFGLAGSRVQKMAQTLSSPLDALGVDPWKLLRWSRDWRRRIALNRGKLRR